MSKIINEEQFINGLKMCQKGKHKLRENQFGVVWCVRCGLLSTSVGSVDKIKNEEILIVKKV